MTINEVTAELGISRAHVYNLINQKLLHPVPKNPVYHRKGGPVLIPRSEVEALKARTKP